MEILKRKIIIESAEVIKTDIASKDGKSWRWFLRKCQIVVLPKGTQQEMTTFDDVTPYVGTDQEVEVEIEKKITEKNGKTYENWSFKLPKRSVWDAIRELEKRVANLETGKQEIEHEQEAEKLSEELKGTKTEEDVSEIPF